MKKSFKLESNAYKKILKLINKYRFSKFDLISNYGFFSDDTNLFKILTTYNLIKKKFKLENLIFSRQPDIFFKKIK